MSLLARLTTWASGQLLKSADLNNEFNNIVNLINNLDAATTTWDSVKTAAFTDTGNASITGTLAAGATTVSGNLGFTTTSTQGILGSTTNDSATTGNVGEYVSSSIGSGSGVTLVNNTAKSVTSISLTAGDWDVSGSIGFSPGGTIQFFQVSISTTNNTIGSEDQFNSITYAAATSPGTAQEKLGTPVVRISVSTTTTVYLVGLVIFGTSCTEWGIIRARRMR